MARITLGCDGVALRERWRYAAFFVCAGLALFVVFRCGYRYPFSDDWDLVVPILDGERRLTLSWLWAQHNEHRPFLSRLIVIVCDTLSGGDFRGAVVASWMMLVATAWILIRLGGYRAVLVISTLVLAPSNNALRWGVETQFVTSALLLVAAMSAIFVTPSAGAIAIAGTAAVLLPLTGGNGVLFAVGANIATLYCAWRAPRMRALACAFVLASAALVAFHFHGYTRPIDTERFVAPSLARATLIVAHLIVAPFGPACSRWIFVTAPLAIVALAIAGVALWRARRVEPVAVTAIATLLVFGAIAFARGGREGFPGLEAHYATLAIPLWGILSVSLVRIGARILPAAIALVTVVTFVLTLPLGPPPPYVTRGADFRRDWCAGVSPRALADRYIDLLYFVDTPAAREQIASELRAWRCPASGR